MSWMSRLYQTYENQSRAEKRDGDNITPIAHMNATAQLEVQLDTAGDFRDAHILEKAEGRTLIPVTESSAARSSGIAPHPLSDTLSYVAGDFENYCMAEKERKTSHNKFSAYMEQLGKWAQSEFTHPKVQAIYAYLQKRRLIADLIQAGIIEVDDNGVFCAKKISGQPYEKAMVRFRVFGADPGTCDSTWEDAALIDSYVCYYFSRSEGKEDICYLTGEKQVVSENHPKGIVAANYGAKLVSANDNQGFTYRGRFQSSDQAYALSYEASQKVHSALTWLIKRQGVYVGSQSKRTFVCWNTEGKSVPDIANAFDLDDTNEAEDTGSYYRKKLWKMLQGYRDHFEEGDSIIVMALDAATTGRLSITYYNEFDAMGFFDRIEEWGLTCNWTFRKWTPDKKLYYTVETPSFRRIVTCAFGRQRGGYIDIDDRVLKEQTQRLVKCMLEKQPVPRDIVKALMDRASTPTAYSDGNREVVLSTACALIRKYEYKQRGKGDETEMKLDVENRDRSYLFGRLLAVLEKVERVTYDRGENREPNAIRLQAAFVNHPMQTWEVLEDALRPYFSKMSAGTREFYKGLISQIIGMLNEEDDVSLNHRLEETYLLGYYLQRAELNKKKEKEERNI